MSRTIKVQIGNQEVDAREMDFEIRREDWSEYKLLDGGTVRVKTTVTRIFMAVDDAGNPRLNEDGTPVIAVNHKTDVVSNY